MKQQIHWRTWIKQENTKKNWKAKQRKETVTLLKPNKYQTPGIELQSVPSDINLELESIPSLDVRRAEDTALCSGRRDWREPTSRGTLENCKKLHSLSK